MLRALRNIYHIVYIFQGLKMHTASKTFYANMDILGAQHFIN